MQAQVMAFCLASTSSWPVARARSFAHISKAIKRGRALQQQPTRSLFNFFKKPETQSGSSKVLLSEDDLFHPLSKSPFPALRQRAEAIKKLAECPVCAASKAQGHPHAEHRRVSFECPDCGWPTHCSEEHWQEDKEHTKFCSRLREANEDEHDLRSGRRMREFELPGPIGYEETISFANWDVFWFTRGFPSMDTERSRRHASKLLTYPITIASVLHQFSGLTLSNQRVTPEGMRSLAALRSTLHMPTGSPETEESGVGKPYARVFVLGARAESSLPAHVWEQLSLLFPSAFVKVFFIGPQVSLPNETQSASPSPSSSSTASDVSSFTPDEKADAPNIRTNSFDDQAKVPKEEESAETEPFISESDEKKSTYLPNIYQPPTPAPISALSRTRNSIDLYGVPSYTTPYKPQVSLIGIQAPYSVVHTHFAETFDPYTDCFFLFSPGFGFPSPSGAMTDTGEPVLQVSSPTEWGDTLPMLLETKCPIFVTGFSPVDVERDVRSLSTAPGVAGEFDWVITPGENAFASEKWEIADFDPRVMVKANWGIWGIRGKRRDIRTREET